MPPGEELAGPSTSGTEAWDAEAVTQLRYRLGMSQAEFSRALGVRQQTVSEWETGLHSPKGASKRMLSVVAEQAAPYDAAASEKAVRPKGRRPSP